MRIAIMQPYMAPYLGYFRLIEQSDVFVILDDVQFIRRGWIHRNKLRNRQGELEWLTLPLEYAPQSSKINEMEFKPYHEELWKRFEKFPALDYGRLPTEILFSAFEAWGPLVPYLTRLLTFCAMELGIKGKKMILASSLQIDGLRGQDRILEICKRLGATEYLNSPGGRELYSHTVFKEHGIELQFLPEWTGRMDSVLQVLAER